MTTTERPCAGCGEPFVPPRNRPNTAKYCSKACMKRHGTWGRQQTADVLARVK